MEGLHPARSKGRVDRPATSWDGGKQMSESGITSICVLHIAKKGVPVTKLGHAREEQLQLVTSVGDIPGSNSHPSSTRLDSSRCGPPRGLGELKGRAHEAWAMMEPHSFTRGRRGTSAQGRALGSTRVSPPGNCSPEGPSLQGVSPSTLALNWGWTRGE